MSIPLTINGTTFDYPETSDVEWGPDATDWAAAVTNGMLQKAGGLFQLLAEVDFGTSYGVKSLYFKSRATNPASAGQVRLGNTEAVSWRNNANGGDLSLVVNASDRLQFNSVNLISASSTDTLTNKTINAPDNTITNLADTNLAADAAIAFSKLATLADGNILVGSSGGVATSVPMSGDVTISNTGAAAIGVNKVLNSMLAQMAMMTIKGNNTGGSANADDLTATEVTAMLDDFVGDSGSGGTKGLVPAPASGDATKFLQGDGTWATPAGAGDVVGPASSTDSGFARFDGTTGKLLKDSAATISNADIANAAAIAYSKLNLTGSIVNADLSASAAIAFSKLATLTSANILVGNGSNVAASVAMSGAITISNTGVTTYNGTVPLNKGGTGQTTAAAALAAIAPTSYTLGTVQVFTSSGTWNKPAGCRAVLVELVGGGGAGGGAATTTAGQTSNGSGGGAGGYSKEWITSLPNSSETVTVGAGGAGNTGASGDNGGTSSFGTSPYLSATGGNGGTTTAASASVRVVIGSAGGSGSGGTINVSGGTGGAATGVAANSAVGGQGGASFFGGGGRASVATTGSAAGSGGTAYGSGGGGAANGTTGNTGEAGGAGKDGIVIVYEFY